MSRLKHRIMALWVPATRESTDKAVAQIRSVEDAIHSIDTIFTSVGAAV